MTHYQEHAPSPLLQAFIACYWTYSGHMSKKSVQRIMPSGCTELVVHFEDLFDNLTVGQKEPRLSLSGPIDSAHTIKPRGNIRLFGIRFQPHGLFFFAGIPVYHLTNQVVSLADFDFFSKDELARISDTEFESILSVVDSIFENKLKGKRSLSSTSRIQFAIQQIQEAQKLSISQLARDVNWSKRQFEDMFKTHVGISAKHYAGILRFNRATFDLIRGNSASLTDVGYQNHYYDQSHFIRTFKRYAGITPSEFCARHQGNFIFA